ncbi:uncharacterized protein LOC141605554 [Silene latifolia]|uniref:uncharacterized protein LOC141605554 n=1 Tax=Silene latifolia TaxID=37657 RepID=UPI003D76D977
MEHRKNNSHGTKNGMKSESLRTQRVYDVRTLRSRGSKNNGVKRKLDSEGLNEVRKKSKKEVLLKSLLSERKNKKSVGQVGKAHISLSSPDSGKAELGYDKKGSSGGGDGGLSGISLKLDGNVYIPKRPRDLVRRKKFDVALASNQEEVSGSIASLVNGKGNENGNTDGGLLHNGNSNGELPQNGVSEGDFSDGVIGNVKKEIESDDHREISLSGCGLVERLKRENSQSPIHKENSDSLIKKAKRLRKKVKETRLAAIRMSRGIEQFSNDSSMILDETQDDEENLEANAARMLSSRFDPSCTMFSSGGKISRESFANGSSPTLSSNYKFDITHPTTLAESNMASSDGEARALRAMDQQKGKSLSRKRRHFYEVLSRDFDCYWVLNRRIMVFWPLDKSWYTGHVTGYNAEKKLHHIKYDDRDEEWVDLQNEKFKLFLLPSEVPEKLVRKRPTTQDKHSGKGKRAETSNKKKKSNSYMESEPIISWLGSSSLHKSPPFGVRKKQRTHESAKSSLPLDCEGKSKLMESPEVNVSGPNVDNLVCGSAVSNNSHASMMDIKLLEHKVLSKNSSSPIVYYRRRFQKRGQQSSDINVPDLRQFSKEVPVFETASDFVDSPDFGLDMLQSMVEFGWRHKNLGSNELIWDIDCPGRLKLFIPITSLKALRCKISLPASVGDNLFGGYNFMFMQQHGTLISVSRMVRLEILFVDNTVGLRFLLFEGCLMQAVSFVFLVLVVFQSNHRESFVGQQLPVTSIRFQFSGLRSLAKQLVFTFYYFTKVASSKWSYLDRKLSKHCVAIKQLPPPECTYGNILALQNGRQLPLISSPHKHLSAMSIQKRPRPQGLSKPPKQSSVKLSHVTSDSDEKLPPFALSYAAAPKFFISLHLKLLMERSISSSSIGEQDLISLVDCSEDYGEIAGVDRLVGKDNSMSCTVSMGFSSGSLLSSKSSLESCVFPDLGDNLLSGDIDGVTAKPSCSSFDLPENGEIAQTDNMTAGITESENCVMSEEHISADNQLSSVNPEIGCGPKANLLTEIPSFISSGSVADAELENVQHPVDSAVVSNDGGVCTPGDTQILFHNSRNGDLSPTTSACLSPGWSDRKPNFIHNGFGNGPRKPRTQVSYSVLLGGNVHNCKNSFHHGTGFSHKRIRRANANKTSDVFGSSKRNTGLLSCDGNCLVTVGDRGWRECGVRVVLELVDHNEWRLVVRISGDSKYSHKPHQFLQPGTTNRYTHAMMWKGGKDWILEFTDRSQWTIFKEMHEECFNRNLRAASVKNIPIPGVRLIEENVDSVLEVPFMRPSSKYHRQLDTDIDIAMNPSRVLYDMDSDDEQWLQKRRGLDFSDPGCGDVSDEMFEKTMDAFEKFAYAKQCDHFSLDELEDAMAGFGPFNTVLNMYEHWREKRQKKGMPLIRHLQPPLWEKYQQQVKEWEQIVSVPSSGCLDKSSAGDKPAMFAFCLKPRGLEAVPSRGSKHRSQKKLPTGFLTNGVSGCPEYFHSPAGQNLNGFSLGDDRLIYSAYNEGASDYSPVHQRSISIFSPRDGGVSMGHFSLNNDGFERNYYSKPYKIKSKKLCFIPQSNDPSPSNNPRNMGKRITGNMWNEWPSQKYSQSEGFQRHNYDQVGPSELDEFRLRDAASAARHAVTVAKLKRENAQRMLCRADLAKQKAVAAIMTAEAVKASYVDANNAVQLTR